MSLTGNLTPLNINTLGSLVQNSGFTINARTLQYGGISTGVDNSQSGETYSATCLNYLNAALRKMYLTPALSSQYQAIQSLGSPIRSLTLAAPISYTRGYNGELASFGWLRLITLQAHNEFHINNGSYSDFVQSFATAESFKKQTNKVIDALHASTTYLDGVYSNMDDLVTGDLSGVSLSLFYWGQDLIRSGRAIDLSSIDTFGNPENLLRTLNKNKALTKAVNLALLTAGFSSGDIDSIISGRVVTPEEQKRLYAAFTIVMGNDLADALIPINCQTQGLDSLADLLNPRKLFPNSYKTLTVPEYNTSVLPTNSKTYYLLYNQDGVSSQVLHKYGERLQSVYPMDLASVCDAFSTTMLQIKHIKTMNIEKFSQVVSNLEVVNDLNVNGTNLPTDQSLAQAGKDMMAKGSGVNGKYTTCDFFGAMSGLTYDWEKLTKQILALETQDLLNYYYALNTAAYAATAPGADTQAIIEGIDQIIVDISNELTNIYNNNTAKVLELEKTYYEFGLQLQKEQDARDLALRGLADIDTNATDIYSFIQSLNQYATETEQYGPVQVLEAIADTNTTGGNSLIGGMRETRNALRLGLVGAEQDNEVGTEKLTLPKINGAVSNVNTGPLVNTPVYTGGNTGNGSMATSPETTLVPSNLNIVDMANVVKSSIITPDQAIQQVIICNCDCWDNLA